MYDRHIKSYIPHTTNKAPNTNYEEDFSPERFEYDNEKNILVCPAGKELRYSKFNKKDRTKRYCAKNRIVRTAPTKKNV